MTAFTRALFWLAAFGLPALTFAQDIDQQYFSFNGYVVDTDAARGTVSDDISGSGGDLLFGWQLSGPWYAEARAFGQIFDVPGGSQAFNGGIGVDLQYLIGSRGKLAAFLLGGGGFAYNDPPGTGGDEGVGMANAGIGLLSREITTSGLRLRFEARAVYEDYLGGVTDFRAGMGFEIPMAAAEVVIREVPVPVADPNAAGDQVPQPRPGAYPPRPVDNDNDGVLDNFDRCPGTLSGLSVDRSGCVVQAQTFTLEGVNFELDSARLTPESRATLERAFAALEGQPGMDVIIAGHTDNQGSEDYNLALSLARADAVKSYLVERGIDPARLTTLGFGESEPIASNETAAGRAQNRRVEFRLPDAMPGAPGSPPASAAPAAGPQSFRPGASRPAGSDGAVTDPDGWEDDAADGYSGDIPDK